MATTKAPTALQLARKKDKLTCSWKIKDKDYKDGQQFQYAFDESRKISKSYRRVQQWSDVKSLNVKETSKAVTVPTGDYYPNTSVYLKGFTFQVRGNRDSYTKKHKTINPGWSEWEVKTFEFSELPKPVMGTPELANEIRCQFPWAMPNSVTNESVKYYYIDLEWESALTRKGAAPTWDIKTGTKSTIVSGSYKTGTFKTFSGTISIEESGTDHLFTGDYSYTRWVRARARGPEGPSTWITKSHVYTEPSVSKNITATLTKVSNGYRCVVKWTSDTNKAKKIDETQVQYCFTVPTADMGCPDGASWENVRNPIPDTQGQNAMQFVLSNPPGQDEVMFVKINNTYDAKEQPGVPILVTGSIQKLKPPTLTAVTPNVETSMVQVTATNNSEVPGSFLAVYYRAGEETGDGQLVGVMLNQTQSIKVPKWGKNGFALGIKAYASAEYTAADASNTQRGRKVVSEGLSKDKQSISITLKDTPKEKTTISVAYTYEYSRRDVTRDRASSLNDFYVNFQAGTSKTITDPDGDDDSYQNLEIVYDGSKTFTFSIKNAEGISPVVKDIEYTFLDSSLSIYSISPKNSEFGYMESDFVWNDGDIPLPPANVKVRQAGNAEDGNATLYVEWEWNWKQANQVELSWADHEDAWESTDEPQTYVIENYKPNHWKIANLAVGKWWVKLRFIKVTDDATVYGTYADAVTDTGEKYINLATSPAIPKLLLQPEVITEDGTTTATWAYQSNDGSEQAFAEIWEKLDDGTYRVFDPEIKTQTQQFINISATGQGWKTGETHNLALKVTSEKGEESPEFSEAVSVTIADKPEIAITETSLETRSVEVNPESETECLTRLPLTVSISGGEGKSSTLSILRLGNSQTYRPDDSEKDGFDGEVIATADSTGGSFIFEKPDIKGYLDEEGMYVLRASTTDSLGQSAVSEDKPFRVLWDHQAVYPSADVTIDIDSLSSQITPSVSQDDVPDGWSIDPDDGFDIYRISSDKPELIYRGAKAGQTIVDPYPAFGNQGGHRIVFVTKYGDYTTADNIQAIYDTDEDDGDILNVFNVTIDFAGERVVLPYDISVSHKWSKDFTETKYLGGSVRGDWNPAVSKTTSINTTVIVEEDPEQIRLMRDLAVYPGLCHVRTPDGSSFTADVEVNEDREEKWVNRLAKFSLSITRVDNDGFDGMTYDEWIS